MLSGAVCFDASWSAKDKARRVAEASTAFGITAPKALYESDTVCLHSLERTADNFRVTRLSPPAGGTEWILADVGYAPRGRKLPESGALSASEILPSLSGRWLSISLDAKASGIRISSDNLGLSFLYIGRLPGGYIFSSDFGAVVRNLEAKPTLNEDVLLAELGVGRSYDHATLAREISVVPAGSEVELQPSGLKFRVRHRYSSGDRFFGSTRQEKFGVLDEIYERIMRDYVSGFGEKAVVSLSGGYDSRTALACIHRYGMKPPLCTFGNPAGNEIREARNAASRVGSETTVFEISGTDWGDWTRRVEALGTSGMIQQSGWCEQWLTLIRTKGTALLLGFLGETIAGKKIAKCEKGAHGGGWALGFANWELANKGVDNSTLLRPSKKAFLLETVREKTREDFSHFDCAFDFQKVLHADLYGRQAKRVGSQPNTLSRFVTPILFFYDSELIDFWCNVPIEDLRHQDLYYSYGNSRFPELFPPREGQRHRDPFWTRAVRFASGMLEGGNSSRQSGVIDHWSIIERHRAEILQLSKATAGVLDAHIDVDAFVRYVNGDNQVEIPPSEAVQAINLMILIDMLQ
jgi:hypothetical protein